jgi:hypothetical protein
MNAEAVLFTPAVGLAILRVLTLLLIPVLPLAAVRATTQALGPARVLWLTPFIEIAAVAIGVLAAPLLLLASTTDNILNLGDIFRPGGPWDLNFIQFITQRAVPLLLSPVELLDVVMTGRAGPDMTRGTILVGAAAAAVVLGPYAYLRDRRGMANGARNLLLLLWGAYATIYTVAVLLWLANLLNFWCFLVLFATTLLVHD